LLEHKKQIHIHEKYVNIIMECINIAEQTYGSWFPIHNIFFS